MKHISLILCVILMNILSCTEQSDDCPSGKVMDKRFRSFPSATLGICIDETCTAESEYCCSGVVEDGKCLSEANVGDTCRILADCGKEAPVCLADPMIRDQILVEAEKIGVDLNNEMLDMLGFNFCTQMECNKEEVTCPTGSSCEDVGSGFYLCKKSDEETPDESPDTDMPDETVEETTDTVDEDTEIPDVAMGNCPDTCDIHDDCKIEGCEFTFCANELKEALEGFGMEPPPPVCAQRCDPANNGTDCPEGLQCMDMSQLAGMVDLDGAKGLCAP